jgi:hypothetical protein
MMTTMTIEAIWAELARLRTAGQRRIDAVHPHDIYADFEASDQVGIVAVCAVRPPLFRSMRAIGVESRQREDGRWSLRLTLLQTALLPVFAALCADIISSTREGVSDKDLGLAVLARLHHWRSLLERDAAGLDEDVLRGLIGELTVLESRLLPMMSALDAVSAWRGPFKAPQDFDIPAGGFIEVKAADRDAVSVRINGAAQLDGGSSSLTLAVVRLQRAGANASGAVTVPALVSRLRDHLVIDADALRIFDAALAAVGWHNHTAHDELAVRVLHIDAYAIDDSFPRLTNAVVPAGVENLSYSTLLPPIPTEVWSVSV